jgi:hypothetical protein
MLLQSMTQDTRYQQVIFQDSPGSTNAARVTGGKLRATNEARCRHL